MKQEQNSVLSRLIVEVARPTHTHSDQLVAEAATHTTHSNTRDEHRFPQWNSNPKFQQ